MFKNRTVFLASAMAIFCTLVGIGFFLSRETAEILSAVGLASILTGNGLSYIIERAARKRGHNVTDSDAFGASIQLTPWKSGKDNLVVLSVADRRWLSLLAKMNVAFIICGVALLSTSCGTMILIVFTNLLHSL